MRRAVLFLWFISAVKSHTCAQVVPDTINYGNPYYFDTIPFTKDFVLREKHHGLFIVVDSNMNRIFTMIQTMGGDSTLRTSIWSNQGRLVATKQLFISNHIRTSRNVRFYENGSIQDIGTMSETDLLYTHYFIRLDSCGSEMYSLNECKYRDGQYFSSLRTTFWKNGNLHEFEWFESKDKKIINIFHESGPIYITGSYKWTLQAGSESYEFVKTGTWIEYDIYGIEISREEFQ